MGKSMGRELDLMGFDFDTHISYNYNLYHQCPAMIFGFDP
jgi:hypothetical protein